MSVNIALRRQIYQLQYYTEGNVPEALIGVPENWNPDQIRQFQAYWDSLNAGDTAERRHAKFVPGGVAKTFVPVREPAMKDAFDEWLARIVCYVFSVPPSAFTGQVNRATADTAQDVALSEGMAPLQLWVKHLIDRVLAEDFASPDLEFAWDQDKDTDPAQTASIASDYVRSGIKSINEVRAELGLPPVKGGEVPKIQTAQGLMPLTQVGGGGGRGAAPAAKAFTKAAFDPDQPRDDHGMWTSDGGDSGSDNSTDDDTSGDDRGGSDSSAEGTKEPLKLQPFASDTDQKPVQVASNDANFATDATSEGTAPEQVAQAETEGISVGYATAEHVLQQQVATGLKTQAEADELLARVKTGDDQANAAVSAALRGHVGIPTDWNAAPAGRGGGNTGVVYSNPNDPTDTVRIMPGNPLSSQPGQQNPYVVDQRGKGNYLTQSGTRSSTRASEETHIPLEKYRFDRR